MGIYGISVLGETLLPLYIFDSSENIDTGIWLNEQSVLGLSKVRGRHVYPTEEEEEEECSFIAVYSSGFMDKGLFQQYIENTILLLYSNIGPGVVRDDGWCLLSGHMWVK